MHETSQTVCGIHIAGFLCEKTEDGYTWTLTTRLGRFLKEAQERFGPRDATYTPLGIEFSNSGPQTWYPGNRRDVAIQLSTSALMDLNQALFQLSHESVHLLSPTGGTRSALVIEEGLATLFSREKSAELRLGLVPHGENYLQAEDLVSNLLSQLGSDVILKIRRSEPCFTAMTPALLESFGAPEKLSLALCEKFQHV